MEPLRADWDGVRGAAATLIEEGKADEAKAFVEAFHSRLAQTKVLDPACGTGNFLYVAMARMKELEGEVLDLLVELGDDQYVAELTGHTITPENFLGIEINPRAAAIAQLVLWIGYLQWHFRVNGADRTPPEPILRDVKTIENRDALIEWDEKVAELDEAGNPVTRWDGETTKEHPVTGKKVPDETARVEVYRFVKPRAAKWPTADFIVGNPPFIGSKRMPLRLGKPYVDALRIAHSDVPGSSDFVMFWWQRCAELAKASALRRFGLITTNSIGQSQSRRVLQRAMSGRQPVQILFAIPDHPWRDAETEADVRVAMTVASSSTETGKLWLIDAENDLSDGSAEVVFRELRGLIHADLSIGAAVADAAPLKANDGMSFQGPILVGEGFRLDSKQMSELGIEKEDLPPCVHPYVIARDVMQRGERRWVIDFFGYSDGEARERFPALYQHVLTHVRPERQANKDKLFRENWWIFGRPRPAMRSAVADLVRYIVTAETAKHKVFTFQDASTLPDHKLYVIASDDAFFLGALSSRLHVTWALAAGGRLGVGNDPTWTNTTTFQPFPFPADVPEPLKDKIRAEAEALDALRKRVLESHEDLTLTKLYNVLEALREGRALTDAERDMHDRGLVTLIRQHHDAIDALVAQAYGWPADLSDGEILTRLVALNKERAAEEARGLIRWLRPEYQAPDYKAPVTQTLDLGETATALPDNVIPWPGSLPEQVSAVQSILTAAATPLAPQDIARAFKGKRAATVRPVLDALAGIGMARRLKDGRYAA